MKTKNKNEQEQKVKTFDVEVVKITQLSHPDEITTPLNIVGNNMPPVPPNANAPEWQSDPMIKQMFDQILEVYTPAQSSKEADVYISTTEFISKFTDMLPDAIIYKNDFTNYLRNKGFKFVLLADESLFNFYWIMRFIPNGE